MESQTFVFIFFITVLFYMEKNYVSIKSENYIHSCSHIVSKLFICCSTAKIGSAGKRFSNLRLKLRHVFALFAKQYSC